MKYPSPAEIEEMRERGYDPSSIADALELSKRWHLQQTLIQQFNTAFEGVKLGDGVGLDEAQGLDGYLSEEQCASLREKDEKDDWRKITAEQLNRSPSSLSFFDEEGMRFHIPAYIVGHLKGVYKHDLVSALVGAYGRGPQFALLNQAQAQAIRAYLAFLEPEPEYDYEREQIQEALENTWIE